MLRRTFSRWIPVVVLMLALAGMLSTASPAQAQTGATAGMTACPKIYPRPAYCDTHAPGYGTVGTDHVGWVYLNLNYCQPGRMCAAIYQSSKSAWRWTGNTWANASLPGGWVYVYPYTGQWRWAWTQRTGWLAVSGGRFEAR